MREIKFRGKRVDNGEWVYGSLIVDYAIPEGSSMRIVPSEGAYSWVSVDPKTVGQYTGLKDKNNKEIYEGDITESPSSIQLVYYDKGQFGIRQRVDYIRDTPHPINKLTLSCWEVIGNIHDNPELLTTV